jgi:enoyl-CoA hydratase/carnithine racemase
VVPFLMDRVAPAVALEWALSARRVQAEEAAQVGLVTHLVADDLLESTVTQLAESLCAAGPAVARGGKRWLDRQLAGGEPDAQIAWCEDQIGIAVEGSTS